MLIKSMILEFADKCVITYELCIIDDEMMIVNCDVIKHVMLFNV